jgi:hypothetical protein
MTMDKTFTRAGVSTQKGKTVFRYTNDLNREKVLANNGHTDILFYELGGPTSKEAATEFLISKGLTEDRPAKPATEPKAAKAPKAAKSAARAADEAVLARMDAGELVHDEATDEFVEPKDEKVQVAMSKKAREYPGLNAQQIYDMVMLDFKAFPEEGEPNF